MNATTASPSSAHENRATSIVVLAAAVLLGAICGSLTLQSWILGFVGLLGVGACLAGIRWPLASWIAMFLFYYVAANYLPPMVSSPLTWICVLVFVAGCWLERLDAPTRVSVGNRGLWTCLLGWLAWALISSTRAMDPGSSIREISRYTLSFLVLFTYLGWLRSEARMRQLVRWWMGLTLAVALAFLIEGALRGLMGAGPSFFLGPYPPGPGELSVLFEAAIPILVSFLLAAPGRLAWRLALSIGIMSVALWWTQSQSACLATLLGVGFVVYGRSSGRMRRGILITACLGLMVSLALLWLVPSVGARLVYELSGRDRVWAAAWQAIREHPILGVGPGCWSAWFSQHFISVDFLMHDLKGNTFYLSPPHLGGEAHNVFLTKAAEMGFSSAIGLMLFLVLWFRAASQAIRPLGPGWLRALSTGCIATMGGLVFHSLFENGPIIGEARGAEVLVVWLLAVLPLLAGRLAVADSGSAAGAQDGPSGSARLKMT